MLAPTFGRHLAVLGLIGREHPNRPRMARTRRRQVEKSGSVTERKLLAPICTFTGSPAKRYLPRMVPGDSCGDAQLCWLRPASIEQAPA